MTPDEFTKDQSETLFNQTKQQNDLFRVLQEDIPRQTLSPIETKSLKVIGETTKVVVIAAIVIPQIAKIAIKGVLFKTLWFWISAMQMYNALSLTLVNVPENVLIVQ